jgi:ABC-type phosphate transport system auxiliary subunit
MIISLIALTLGIAYAKDLLEYAIQTKKYNQEVDDAWTNKIEAQERLLSCLRLQQDKLEFKTQKSMALSKDAVNELEILQLKVKEAKEFLQKIEEEIKKKSSVLENTNPTNTNPTSKLFNLGKQPNVIPPDLGEDPIQKEMDNITNKQ